MNRITATYDIESPVGVQRAAEVLAGEQSTGTFTRLAAETDALRERSAARIEGIEITGTSSTPSLPSRKTGELYERGTITISWSLDNLAHLCPRFFPRWLATCLNWRNYQPSALSTCNCQAPLPQIIPVRSLVRKAHAILWVAIKGQSSAPSSSQALV